MWRKTRSVLRNVIDENCSVNRTSWSRIYWVVFNESDALRKTNELKNISKKFPYADKLLDVSVKDTFGISRNVDPCCVEASLMKRRRSNNNIKIHHLLIIIVMRKQTALINDIRIYMCEEFSIWINTMLSHIAQWEVLRMFAIVFFFFFFLVLLY